MTQLSPAAQAVLDAYMKHCGWLDGPLEKDYRCAAAVLRAVADQVVPEEAELVSDQQVRWKLLSIANELENNARNQHA